MKTQISLLAFCGAAAIRGALVHAAPFEARFGVSDTANDWASIIAGKTTCAKVAVIFARGTFDSGNIGVWVGPQFFEALKSQIKGVALQGVDPGAYPADLLGYLKEKGGSREGAKSMAKMVIDYQAKCPKSAVVLSGWSQGAIVAHKALAALDFAKVKVAGLATFGDPNHVWDQMPLPASLPASSFNSECVTGSLPDPLCAKLPQDFKFPTSPSNITAAFSERPKFAVGAQQIAAAASLLEHFPGQLAHSFTAFESQLRPTRFVRLLLTPEHFTYGNSDMAKKAAAAVVDFVAVAAAMKG